MDKHYDSKAAEAKWYPIWEKNGYFHQEPDGRAPYSVVIPPPNVTGILHMGHALNQTIQDILVRWRRMQGRNTLWLPGTDHAGIATQNVVEKALKKEGKRRQDLGREKFLERVWEWKKQYGGTIVHQQRMLGNSTDWLRERFTFDEGCSRAVAKVFTQLYNEGLVYKGNYIVNWCPRCGTALANDEVEHEPNHGHFWYVRYPVVGSAKGVKGEPYKDYVMVATTRPETLPGDTAVAVNPKDVISDDYVDREFGTGIVKITPAHDPNDFLVGKRHGLAEINIMTDDAHMNELAGEKYCGMDRWECRKAIVEDLEAGGYLDHIEDIDNQVGHCYRCHETVESRLSKQWFVKMKPLAEPAIAAVKSGEVKFVPERWSKIYFNWMENIQDWCISRQLWWGHRIPAYYLGDDVFVAETAEEALAQAKAKTGNAALTLADLEQDPDVLDTWFSSWLWPFSTLGWPEKTKDLEYYYPTTDLVTAQDIIFFWVARMMMAGIHFMKKPPFRNIVIHGIVRAADGSKMSKSKGNSLDPLELIDQYSADALRFSIALITSLECDTKVNKEKFEIGRNFTTKIWNAAKFLSMQTEAFPQEGSGDAGVPVLSNLSADDRHILYAADLACRRVSEILEAYRIQDGALAVYDFCARGLRLLLDADLRRLRGVREGLAEQGRVGRDSPRRLLEGAEAPPSVHAVRHRGGRAPARVPQGRRDHHAPEVPRGLHGRREGGVGRHRGELRVREREARGDHRRPRAAGRVQGAAGDVCEGDDSDGRPQGLCRSRVAEEVNEGRVCRVRARGERPRDAVEDHEVRHGLPFARRSCRQGCRVEAHRGRAREARRVHQVERGEARERELRRARA